mmetsp:Transcript_22024/g.35381  ORF Transcript_22024/g.35381 Transcript_22024/m.35381 type:complete len:417 (-) Transcript_22024:1148-2398(-)
MEAIVGLMTKVGPVVQAVVMDASGEFSEQTMDMTPAKDEITKLLQGQATFIGKFREQGVVLMCVREPVEEVHSVNSGVLPYPFDAMEDTVHGSVLLLKMSDDAEPESFTLEDFKILEAAQKDKKANGIDETAIEENPEDDADVAQEEDDAEEGEEEDEDGEDEDDDEDDDGEDDDDDDDDGEDDQDDPAANNEDDNGDDEDDDEEDEPYNDGDDNEGNDDDVEGEGNAEEEGEEEEDEGEDEDEGEGEDDDQEDDQEEGDEEEEGDEDQDQDQDDDDQEGEDEEEEEVEGDENAEGESDNGEGNDGEDDAEDDDDDEDEDDEGNDDQEEEGDEEEEEEEESPDEEDIVDELDFHADHIRGLKSASFSFAAELCVAEFTRPDPVPSIVSSVMSPTKSSPVAPLQANDDGTEKYQGRP